jgi:hypothetical protein
MVLAMVAAVGFRSVKKMRLKTSAAAVPKRK